MFIALLHFLEHDIVFNHKRAVVETTAPFLIFSKNKVIMKKTIIKRVEIRKSTPSMISVEDAHDWEWSNCKLNVIYENIIQSDSRYFIYCTESDVEESILRLRFKVREGLLKVVAELTMQINNKSLTF